MSFCCLWTLCLKNIIDVRRFDLKLYLYSKKTKSNTKHLWNCPLRCWKRLFFLSFNRFLLELSKSMPLYKLTLMYSLCIFDVYLIQAIGPGDFSSGVPVILLIRHLKVSFRRKWIKGTIILLTTFWFCGRTYSTYRKTRCPSTRNHCGKSYSLHYSLNVQTNV